MGIKNVSIREDMAMIALVLAGKKEGLPEYFVKALNRVEDELVSQTQLAENLARGLDELKGKMMNLLLSTGPNPTKNTKHPVLAPNVVHSLDALNWVDHRNPFIDDDCAD